MRQASYMGAGKGENMGWINFHQVSNEEEPKTHFKVKIMVFTEGTVIGPPNLLKLYNHASYVPIKKAVEKLTMWGQQGADIQYLTSRKKVKQIDDIQIILTKNSFPGSKLYFRGRSQSYKNIIETVVPDIIIEDNCRSIGGRWQMAITYVAPEKKERIKSIVVKEFKGIDHLPDSLSELSEGDV